jgi:hypothetical protein
MEQFERMIGDEPPSPRTLLSKAYPGIIDHDLDHAAQEHSTLIGAGRAESLDGYCKPSIADQKAIPDESDRLSDLAVTSQRLHSSRKANAPSKNC